MQPNIILYLPPSHDFLFVYTNGLLSYCTPPLYFFDCLYRFSNDFLLCDRLHWPWHTDRSLHHTPIRVSTSLATRGCNTHAAAEHTDLQWGGVSTEGTLTAELYSEDFTLSAVHSTSTWGMRDARAGRKKIGDRKPPGDPQHPTRGGREGWRDGTGGGGG